MGALGQHVLLGAGHSNIEGFIHGKTPAGILTVSSPFILFLQESCQISFQVLSEVDNGLCHRI
jgi:hypothetical protein